ncbi:MAG TPA: OB-fold nucleic acid binding domain-containing protein, partial [Candidatus Limnocylindrales bacterium]
FEPFERYGFNKAHATCYGLIAYQTAYLKANYTVEYMTSVLSAFRDNAEKVAAAVAECRRLGIEVAPPDVHRSGLGFTVEGESIRFGLLAVKNVGEGAIQSIIDAREADGEFRSLTDFCSRVDVRLANRKVLESLAKVGALNVFGHPAQILLGLDDALAAGQATQRDRITGQTSLFDMTGDDSAVLERPLPVTPETPVRERLRWEKELLGLYLSDHPMGEVAERVGHFVTAYSGDLKDESLDGQRVVIGGIVTGSRTVITKSKSTMAVVTLEDLQGTLEVVVFPRTYEQTIGTWREGAILLVAGRVDHRGEEASLLADAVWDWDTVADRGAEAFAREVGALDRRGGGRRGGPGAPGSTNGHGNGNGNGYGAPRDPVAVGPGRGAVVPAGAEATAVRVSPTRAADPFDVAVGPSSVTEEPDLPRVAPGEPIATYAEPPDLANAAMAGGAEEAEEPPLPDEQRNVAAAAAQAPSDPVDASPGAVLNVRFARDAGSERVVSAMQAFKSVLRERPGGTRVVVHVPAPGGSALPMELRGVAYDAELLAELRRRVGEGVIDLSLG